EAGAYARLLLALYQRSDADLGAPQHDLGARRAREPPQVVAGRVRVLEHAEGVEVPGAFLPGEGQLQPRRSLAGVDHVQRVALQQVQVAGRLPEAPGPPAHVLLA